MKEYRYSGPVKAASRCRTEPKSCSGKEDGFPAGGA